MKNKRYEVNYVMKGMVSGSTIFTSKAKAYAYYSELAKNKRCVRIYIVEQKIIEGTYGSVTNNPRDVRWN